MCQLLQETFQRGYSQFSARHRLQQDPKFNAQHALLIALAMGEMHGHILSPIASVAISEPAYPQWDC
jgi:hypothetical protein